MRSPRFNEVEGACFEGWLRSSEGDLGRCYCFTFSQRTYAVACSAPAVSSPPWFWPRCPLKPLRPPPSDRIPTTRRTTCHERSAASRRSGELRVGSLADGKNPLRYTPISELARGMAQAATVKREAITTSGTRWAALISC